MRLCYVVTVCWTDLLACVGCIGLRLVQKANEKEGKRVKMYDDVYTIKL